MNLTEKLRNLPERSGVYIMRDAQGTIIYVGKARVLKNRVKQYFSNSPKQPKVEAMVSNIADFDYIITLTEKDAFALEANLVKKHQPRYNILLKDDKASPYIKIDLREDYPTIEVTRKLKRDGSRYFGPYFAGIRVWDMVDIVKNAYGMRACAKKIAKRDRECLNYHIKLCHAPCVKRISKEDYAEVVSKVMSFLSGRDNTAEKLLTQKMEQAAQNEEFERAIQYRDRLTMLKKLKERDINNIGKALDADCFYYLDNGEYGVVSVNVLRGGKMVGIKDYLVSTPAASAEDSITSFMAQYYGNNEIPREIYLQSEFDTTALTEYLTALSSRSVEISVPQKGVKHKLMEMTRLNAEDYLQKSADKYRREYNKSYGAVSRLEKTLGIKNLRRMECYDISNISGTDKTASQAVFIDGQPAKAHYRRYKIKTVEGSDDFASLHEVITRRIEKYKEGNDSFNELPDLIVIDGGKGQLSSAHRAMTESGISIPMISLAEANEEIFTLGSHLPIVLSKNDIALQLLQRIRDEAHRFAVSYHRTLRSKRMTSELTKIPGIGDRRRKLLLDAFPRFEDIKNAQVSELSAVKGIDLKTAQSIFEYYRAKDGKDSQE